MTTLWVLWVVVGLLALGMAVLGVAVVLVSRNLGRLAQTLRLAPLTPSQFREPEPGSYILSDAEAAQVEADLLVESRGRAQSRGARGWLGFKSS